MKVFKFLHIPTAQYVVCASTRTEYYFDCKSSSIEQAKALIENNNFKFYLNYKGVPTFDDWKDVAIAIDTANLILRHELMIVEVNDEGV